MRKFVAISVVAILFAASSAMAGTWTSINKPGASATCIRGISGNNLVGYYTDITPGLHGFLYDGITWTQLDAPGAYQTFIRDIDGNKMVGSYNDLSAVHGFMYDGTNWTILDAPGASETSIQGISGNKVVAYASNGNFEYDLTTSIWTPLNLTGTVYGISGNKIVGTSGSGFVYDGTTTTTFSTPGAFRSEAYGIDGGNVVGYYYNASGSHGYLYNLTSNIWTTIGTSECVYDIEGYKLVGDGFMYEVPEPASVLLLGLGAVILGLRRRKH